MVGTVHDGRYRILRKLGEGGMGEVYLAEHLALGRREALKILRPEFATSHEFVQRFRREARATNRVQHPNIVSVYDFGKLPDGRFFLSMEYAEGERIDRVLNNIGAFPVPRALKVLAQLADAVDHAHSRGVIHRDLKPENFILTEHRGHADVLKVLDFGIAKIISPEYETIGLTQKGEVFGTPAFMAPEQFNGTGTEPRSDLYAIGCNAFELLVGEPPFRGRPMELMHAHATQQPDRPSRRAPHAGIPPELDALVLRCLEKDPDRRFQTGRDLVHALRQIPGFSARPASDRRRRQLVVGDFDAIHTEETTNVVAQPDRDLRSAAPTQQLTIPDARAGVRDSLLDLAERLLDLGCKDYQLIIGVTNLQEREQDLTRAAEELGELEARAAAVEQAARERDASLRFALGELSFDRAEAQASGAPAAPDLDYQINQLAQRLAQVAADLERDLAILTERSIAVVATRASREEELDQLYDGFHRLVAEIARSWMHVRELSPLVERLRRADELLTAATRQEGARR